MIEVNATINEYKEEGIEYILKEYNIISDYPNSIAKIIIDGLKNQTRTNDDGVALISTSNTDEHTLKITINKETITETL